MCVCVCAHRALCTFLKSFLLRKISVFGARPSDAEGGLRGEGSREEYTLPLYTVRKSIGCMHVRVRACVCVHVYVHVCKDT